MSKHFSLLSSSRRSKKRRTKRNKRSNKRHTRRVYKMRGGWGGIPMTSIPQIFKKGGVMKGGWGAPVTSNPV